MSDNPVDKRTMSAGSLRRLIAERSQPEGRTICRPPGAPLPPDAALPDPLSSAVAGSETGAIVYPAPDETVVVLPPFPVEQEAVLEGWRTEPLEELFGKPRRTGVLLLRLGGFAVGIFDNDELVSSKVGGRFVKGRHSKGGSSQARFARRREEQARGLFRKACEVLRAQIEASGSLDHVVFGGDRRTLAAFEKECGYVQGLESLRLRRILDVPDPKRSTLEALPRKLYESIVWRVGP